MVSQGRDPIEVAHECCWCGKGIPDGTELFAIGGRLRPGVDISEYEGAAMPITMSTRQKTIYAVVPAEGSDAMKEGKDFCFVVCSRRCGRELKEALEQEIARGDILESAYDL